mmetsp:Transcript_7491/g.16310  ORF Transcript_7491/g.16310 Transcript_7491/m.16310 type:complete len:94 (-) Transcript_7491:64-345(-)
MHPRDSAVSHDVDLGTFLGGRLPEKSSTAQSGLVSKKPSGLAPLRLRSHQIEKAMGIKEASYYQMSGCSGTCCHPAPEVNRSEKLHFGARFSL